MGRRTGLTFVEMLIATGLLTMVIAVAGGTLAGGLRVWSRLRNATAQDQQELLAFQQLRRQLLAARSFQPVPFEGTYDKLTFPAAVLWADEEGAESPVLAVSGYYLDPRSGSFCHSVYPYEAQRRYRLRDFCDPVLERVVRVRFAYLQVNKEEGRARWVRRWDAPGTPRGVRIELVRDAASQDADRRERIFTVMLPGGSIQDEEGEGP